MPCPYIDICLFRVSKEHFDKYCKSSEFFHKCPYVYYVVIRRVPRDWLKEEEK